MRHEGSNTFSKDSSSSSFRNEKKKHLLGICFLLFFCTSNPTLVRVKIGFKNSGFFFQTGLLYPFFFRCSPLKFFAFFPVLPGPAPWARCAPARCPCAPGPRPPWRTPAPRGTCRSGRGRSGSGTTATTRPDAPAPAPGWRYSASTKGGNTRCCRTLK